MPEDLNPQEGCLQVEEEQAQMQEALLPWQQQGLVKLYLPNDGRLTTLAERLQTVQPHLLLLSGHGTFEYYPHSDQPGVGYFIFESETGQSDPRPEGEIAALFSGSRVGCVILSACESGRASSESLNHGLARQLKALGIPHVIGMRERILDEASILFARHFGDAIARRERVDVALQQARAAMTTPLKDRTWRAPQAPNLRTMSLEWCLPNLLTSQVSQPLIAG